MYGPHHGIANADTYNISTLFEGLAGSITTIALGISDLGDFRDEISIERIQLLLQLI